MTADIATLPMTRRAEGVSGPPQGCWTYDAYAALPEDGHRYEVIAGVLYMAAAPSIAHQASVGRFTTHLTVQVEFAGKGRVFVAPCDVELAAGTVVQPDVFVVLTGGRAQLTPGRVIGPPDLVIEVASPGTAGYDRREKQDAYARAGVPELWHADPFARSIEVLGLEAGVYRSLGVVSGAATLPSRVALDLPLRAEQFFV